VWEWFWSDAAAADHGFVSVIDDVYRDLLEACG
jgi:hypothetical protein